MTLKKLKETLKEKFSKVTSKLKEIFSNMNGFKLFAIIAIVTWMFGLLCPFFGLVWLQGLLWALASGYGAGLLIGQLVNGEL